MTRDGSQRHRKKRIYIYIYHRYVIRTNKMFTGRWQGVDILPSTRLLIWMHEGNIIEVHVQVFLRMNTWMFETCRRQYNQIKTLMKKCAFCWFLLHGYFTMHGSKNVKYSTGYSFQTKCNKCYKV